MEKTICIIIIFILSMASITLAVETAPAEGVSDIYSLMKVSEKIAGEVVGYSIQGHVKVDEIYSKEELDKELKFFLGQDLDYATTDITEDYAYGEWSLGDTYHNLSMVVDSDNQGTYVVYSLELSQESCLITAHNHMFTKVSKYGEPFIAASIHKIYNGTLSSSFKLDNIEKGFSQVDASLNLDSEGAGYIGYVGYAESIENHVMINDEKVNLHITVSTDETQNLEYINIATPLIINSY
ncbi:YwmB family TATA-box binding protein [Proteinivorax hydrogeniformans]|uniref:YwmB family TATA-box binding protein n=1 Tax=Proteinivorax hydrogeniformans TaxID=1826727 RepID=A0AAU8HSX5_9FIRM